MIPPVLERPSRPRKSFLVALLALLAACSPETEAGPSTSSGGGAASPSVEKEVLDLVTAVTPLSPTLPVGERNAWYGRRKETLERLRGAGPAVGREALRVYHEREDAIPEVRIGLLDVAAHNVPEETRSLLLELVVEYGDHMYVRAKATGLLGETAPEAAVEVLEPILRGQGDRATYPPAEDLLDAWNTASVKLDRDRVPLLCEFSTDITNDPSARHKAVKLLGDTPSEQGRQALEEMVVESSGNNYIRRLAAQSLQRTVSTEELCPFLREVRKREVDPNYMIFLDSMLAASCP